MAGFWAHCGLALGLGLEIVSYLDISANSGPETYLNQRLSDSIKGDSVDGPPIERPNRDWIDSMIDRACINTVCIDRVRINYGLYSVGSVLTAFGMIRFASESDLELWHLALGVLTSCQPQYLGLGLSDGGQLCNDGILGSRKLC